VRLYGCDPPLDWSSLLLDGPIWEVLTFPKRRRRLVPQGTASPLNTVSGPPDLRPRFFCAAHARPSRAIGAKPMLPQSYPENDRPIAARALRLVSQSNEAGVLRAVRRMDFAGRQVSGCVGDEGAICTMSVCSD